MTNRIYERGDDIKRPVVSTAQRQKFLMPSCPGSTILQLWQRSDATRDLLVDKAIEVLQEAIKVLSHF
jgi:hypothetical protein